MATTGTLVSLKRLLYRCEQRIRDQEDDAAELKTSPKFHHYVETLKQLLGEIDIPVDSASGTDGHESVSGELESLRGRVQAVADFLGPERKADFCRMVSRAPAVGLGQASSMMSGRGPGAPSSLLGRGGRGVQSGGTAASRQQQLSAVGEGLIKRQRQLQDELTDEMVSMASGLKNNSLMLEEELRQSGKVLDSTHDLMAGNLDATKYAKDSATKQYAANARGSCMTWLMLLAVGMLFVFTALFIRVFSVKV